MMVGRFEIAIKGNLRGLGQFFLLLVAMGVRSGVSLYVIRFLDGLCENDLRSLGNIVSGSVFCLSCTQESFKAIFKYSNNNFC